MGLILDTIIYADMVFSPERLSERTQNFIAEQDKIFITLPTVWEIANHVRKGIYDIGGQDFDIFIKQTNEILGVEIINISWQGLNWLSVTPYITAFGKPHKDTFDRMIIAHAIVNNLPIISKDNAFQFYESVGLISYHVRY